MLFLSSSRSSVAALAAAACATHSASATAVQQQYPLPAAARAIMEAAPASVVDGEGQNYIAAKAPFHERKLAATAAAPVWAEPIDYEPARTVLKMTYMLAYGRFFYNDNRQCKLGLAEGTRCAGKSAADCPCQGEGSLVGLDGGDYSAIDHSGLTQQEYNDAAEEAHVASYYFINLAEKRDSLNLPADLNQAPEGMLPLIFGHVVKAAQLFIRICNKLEAHNQQQMERVVEEVDEHGDSQAFAEDTTECQQLRDVEYPALKAYTQYLLQKAVDDAPITATYVYEEAKQEVDGNGEVHIEQGEVNEELEGI